MFPTNGPPIVFYKNGILEFEFGFWSLLERGAYSQKQLQTKPYSCRVENISTLEPFRSSWIECKRCVVPVSYFVLWKKTFGKPIPHAIRQKDERITTLAGIWDHVQDGSVSFSILTTAPPAALSSISTAVPLIVKDWSKWVHPKTPRGELKEIMVPFKGEIEILDIEQRKIARSKLDLGI